MSREGSLERLVGQVLAARYRILERVGAGAMGTVFRAEHVKIGRKLAVKVLHPRMLENEKFRRRFDREAELAGKLHHPNVVGVLDVGITPEGLRYLVMEYAEGCTLAETIAEGPMGGPRMMSLARRLCDGLQHAHDQGLIHRDFKPENVIVERDRHGDELPRILDFGVAIALSDFSAGERQRLTTEGIVLGTPQYMAPEQATDKTIDPRIDLFALGVMCFEMLTGVMPFRGTGAEIVRAYLSRPIPPMQQRTPTIDVDPLLEAFTRALLARSPDARPPSAKAARALLELIERDRAAAAAQLGVSLAEPSRTVPGSVPIGRAPSGTNPPPPETDAASAWTNAPTEKMSTDPDKPVIVSLTGEGIAQEPVVTTWSGPAVASGAGPAVAISAGSAVAPGAKPAVVAGTGSAVAPGAKPAVASGTGSAVATWSGLAVASGAGSAVTSGAGPAMATWSEPAVASDAGPHAVASLDESGPATARGTGPSPPLSPVAIASAVPLGEPSPTEPSGRAALAASVAMAKLERAAPAQLVSAGAAPAPAQLVSAGAARAPVPSAPAPAPAQLAAPARAYLATEMVRPLPREAPDRRRAWWIAAVLVGVGLCVIGVLALRARRGAEPPATAQLSPPAAPAQPPAPSAELAPPGAPAPSPSTSTVPHPAAPAAPAGPAPAPPLDPALDPPPSGAAPAGAAPATPARPQQPAGPAPAAPAPPATAEASPADPSTEVVAELYGTIGRALKRLDETHGQEATYDLWPRFRRIRILEALRTREGRTSALDALRALERDIGQIGQRSN
ncbi:MAG TPA: protein kinase [Kofleriaceae bacterium]|nr:protein kinase [Kofleriaceae bacterium]